MKRKIILFLLNLIGGNKNQENEEEKGARRTGCGCLLAILGRFRGYCNNV